MTDATLPWVVCRVLPNGDREHYVLKDTLEQAKATMAHIQQTYPSWELCLVRADRPVNPRGRFDYKDGGYNDMVREQRADWNQENP